MASTQELRQRISRQAGEELGNAALAKEIEQNDWTTRVTKSNDEALASAAPTRTNSPTRVMEDAESAIPVCISGQELDAMLAAGKLKSGPHALGGPFWANVWGLLMHTWWAVYISSYMRTPLWVPYGFGGADSPFSLRLGMFCILVVFGVVHHCAAALNLNYGLSFEFMDKLVPLMLITVVGIGLPCLFSAYAKIFTAPTWYLLLICFICVAFVIPELAKRVCLIKQGPTPERLALPELYKQATEERWAWMWHAFALDGATSAMYLCTWLCMPETDQAKLMAWAWGDAPTFPPMFR